MIGLVALPVGALAVLGVEVQLARHGPDLPDDTPLEHDGVVGTADGAPLRMVWLGDSTAAGVGASSVEHALPRRVAAALERPVEVTSLAVSGARIADLVGDQLDRLEALAAYGESERRLGEIGVAQWRVISKLPAIPESCADVRAWVQELVLGSLERLKIPRLGGLLLHRSLQLLEPKGENLYRALTHHPWKNG